MSTYNGEKYLQEQIDSILTQKNVEVYLVIRDDGSSDGTRDILNSYKSRFDNIAVIYDDNVGCKQSFYLAAKYLFYHNSEIKYFAFADQDDFWLEDKLISGIHQLIETARTNEGIPLLYFCPPLIVDKNLIPQKIKWGTKHLLTFTEACLSQPCAGCTMVSDRRALELFLMGSPEKMSMHDSWMYKTVLACGGKVIEDTTPHILYRQHGNNVIGTQTFSSRWKRRLRNFRNKNKYRSRQVGEIYQVYSKLMPQENVLIASELSEYSNESLFKKLRIAFNPKYKLFGKINNFLFKIAIICNRY